MLSNGPPDPEPPVFFIDRDLGCRVFPGVLRAANLRIVLHDEIFPASQKVPDDEWLRYIAEHGLVGVSHDSKIRYTSASREDIMQYGARLLILKGKASHEALARNFVLTYPAVLRFLRRHPAPIIAKVYRDPHDATRPGRVEMWLSLAI